MRRFPSFLEASRPVALRVPVPGGKNLLITRFIARASWGTARARRCCRAKTVSEVTNDGRSPSRVPEESCPQGSERRRVGCYSGPDYGALYSSEFGLAKDYLASIYLAAELSLLACLPVAWLSIEFLDAFLKELARLARDGGASAAGIVARIPQSVATSLARHGPILRTGSLPRRSFDGRYRRRLYEDYGLFNDKGLGLINASGWTWKRFMSSFK